MPLFGFLEIPDALNKQFKVPSGCKLTKESIALRKVKTLGGQRNLQILKPGCYMPPLTKPYDLDSMEQDVDAEELPTAVTIPLPAFEPLVLWTDDTNNHKVEVISLLSLFSFILDDFF